MEEKGNSGEAEMPDIPFVRRKGRKKAFI